MEWNILPREEGKEILERIRSESDPDLFPGSFSEIQVAELPFYSGFMLYKVTNYATMPPFVLEYLGDGNNFFLLDGSADPIYFANKRCPIELAQKDVSGYLDFFFSHVDAPDGDIFLIHDPNTAPVMESLPEQQKKVISGKFQPMTVSYDGASDAFKIACTLFYSGSLVTADMDVSTDGAIKMNGYHMLLPGLAAGTAGAALTG